MEGKKESKKKKKDKITELNQKLEDEIKERTEITDFLTEEKNVLYQNIMKEIRSKKESKDRLKIRMEEHFRRIEKIKDDLLNYALQIVSIIVAILAVIFTISFLSTDFYKAPDTFIWMVVVAIVYFLFIFTWYVKSWIKINKVPQRFDGVDMTTIGHNPNGNEIDTSDWLQYLEHRATSNLNRYLTFFNMCIPCSAIILSAIAILYSMDMKEIAYILLIPMLATVFLMVYIHWFKYYSYPSRQGKLAEELLKDILLEKKYTNVNKIREKWKTEMVKIDNLKLFEKYTYNN